MSDFIEQVTENNIEKNEATDVDKVESNEEEYAIWESQPIECNSAEIQILDKISGKVFMKNVKINEPIIFGTIKLSLIQCFKNSDEEPKECYAYIKINDMTSNGKQLFSNWLFASSPSINLFTHPVYDIRIEM